MNLRYRAIKEDWKMSKKHQTARIEIAVLDNGDISMHVQCDEESGAAAEIAMEIIDYYMEKDKPKDPNIESVRFFGGEFAGSC
jgi:hypothetical protein